MKHATILVAVGANLPGPLGRTPIETCRHAIACMDLLQSLRLCGLSRWYLTAPVPASGQPDYINAVASLMVEPDATIAPEKLLADLMAIETACGRRRGEPNAARTLDLDIIDIGGMVRTAPDPILPHPRAHQRAFVLAPLSDVAPAWVHPVLGATVRTLLAGLVGQTVRVL
jgi:2-amino-4-hydroxy-6-hydroxymethyldihydropteridine diphosphokinase